MEISVMKDVNLHGVTDKQWESFCDYIEKSVETSAKKPVAKALVMVNKEGTNATIAFDILSIKEEVNVVVKFDQFLCKEWKLRKGDKIEKMPIPPHEVTLAWQTFLTKSLGDRYKQSLDKFYAKNKIDTRLINTLIKNSKNNFEV